MKGLPRIVPHFKVLADMYFVDAWIRVSCLQKYDIFFILPHSPGKFDQSARRCSTANHVTLSWGPSPFSVPLVCIDGRYLGDGVASIVTSATLVLLLPRPAALQCLFFSSNNVKGDLIIKGTSAPECRLISSMGILYLLI